MFNELIGRWTNGKVSLTETFSAEVKYIGPQNDSLTDHNNM